MAFQAYWNSHISSLCRLVFRPVARTKHSRYTGLHCGCVYVHTFIYTYNDFTCRSQCPSSLRRRSAASRQLRSSVRFPPEEWMFVCCKRCVLSGRGLCDELITRPEESYRMWCVVLCDQETSRMRSWPALGRSATGEKKNIYIYILHTQINKIAQIMLHVHLFLTMICYQLKGFSDSRAAHKEEQEIMPEKGTALTHGS